MTVTMISGVDDQSFWSVRIAIIAVATTHKPINTLVLLETFIWIL